MPEHEFTITLRDVYNEIQKIEARVSDMAPSVTIVADHEVRLRALERWRYALPPTIFLAVLSTVGLIVEVMR